MSEAAISVRNLSKRFQLFGDRPTSLKEAVTRRSNRQSRDFWALKDVSLEIPKGSFFGLIGHNGSGKSTLLRMMAGIHNPTSGTVTTSGRVSALLELGSGFHPDLTGRENIYLNGAILGLSRSDIERSIDSIIDFSGLGDFIETPVKAYSSGMYVRLGFAVAVNVKPDILLVDEVIAVGDEDFQRRCLDHMYNLRRAGTTIVFVSHGLAMVESLCDTVAWLDHGEVQHIGESSESVGLYLEMANAQEQGRLEQEEPAEPPAGESELDPTATGRRGTGEIIVERTELLNSERNAAVTVAESGSPLVVRLWYRADTDVDSPVFGLGFHHEAGVLVSRVFCPPSPNIARGQGYIDLVFERFPLLSGNFFISTLVISHDHLRTFDELVRAQKLIVQPASGGQGEGLVELRPVAHPPVPHEVPDSPPPVI